MKTNFTMTKRLLFGFAALAMVVSSCSDDDPVVVAPDISGIYTFSGAVLVDGNLPDADDTNLTILNGAVDPATGAPMTAVIPAGDTGAAGTSFFVNAVLSGLAPCTAAPVTYEINFKEGGTLAFICTSEGDVSEDNGTWALSSDFRTLTLTIVSSTLGQVVVTIESAVLVPGESGSIAGTIGALPMIVDAAASIGQDNIQFITTDVVLTK